LKPWREEPAVAEQEKILKYWVEVTGTSIRGMNLRMQDDDLWLLDPASRFELEGEEAVRQWEQAARFARGISLLASDSEMLNQATKQLLWDTADRAAEALRRARQRREEATAE
jgi:hypothetical protein